MHRRSFLKLSAVALATAFFSTKLCAEMPSAYVLKAPGNPALHGKVQRILSAGPNADVLLSSLAPDKLIGFSSLEIPERRKKYLPKRLRTLPGTGRIAGRGSTFPLEKIMLYKPDIILDVGEVSDHFIASLERVSEQTGIPYAIAFGRLSGMVKMLRDIGLLLEVEERANLLADFTEKTLARLAMIRDQSPHHNSVYIARSANGLETGLGGSIHAEAVELCGARNVAAEAGQGRYVRISMEKLVGWDPDIILAQNAEFYRHAQKDPLFKTLRAVRENRLYLAPHDPYGWVDTPTSVNRLLGMIWLSRLLYPESLPKDEYHTMAKEYFKLFYEYDLTTSELIEIASDI